MALLLSIFNIINLVASNVNNNNNRNNINDNSGNLNTADNAESNANSGSNTATQVMMVPPGVGRRRRDLFEPKKALLSVENSMIILSADNDLILLEQILPSNMNRDFLDEIPLGIIATLNAWQIESALNNATKSCTERNLCELGLNCAVFGPGSSLSCFFGAHVMTRWVATNDAEEKKYLRAFEDGIKLENCHDLHNENCPVALWNEFLAATKNRPNTCDIMES